ncbi:SDR family NAD(P)-dependent oxidoreductase [Gordonia sp. NB41Y]|uniref:SDR family NAD(P)-dependent oxidoreductase n=1 Tax=Gordonia sp. NB41Y TaxID=875808 RepID=UPI0002BEA4E2|nr:SDR family NAD(P)-dependent oxidoreductase [Gordonia sp. NB41Y]WLP92005.1 SDR family NAD(P)-dependent oxidoreductase [Gordonia sp. NB41Y]
MSTAVVVGGASGIGRAAADRLTAAGHHVVVADVNADAVRTAAAEIGGDWLYLDVTDERSVAAGFTALDDVAVVVNCAGLSMPGPIVDLELSAWQTTVDVCLTGTFLVLKHAGRRIVDGGSIVCVASLNGRQPGTGMAAYCAAKAGVLMLVEVAALELAERGVRVNAVSPGLVDTPLTEGISFIPGLREEYLENTPLGRAGTPGDVADTIAFLASPASGWMTGSAIDLNGGAHMRRYPDLLGRIKALADDG